MAESVTDRSTSSGYDWLYPELLTRNSLLQALKQHQVEDLNLEQLNKNELVELYVKYITPLPQRKYRQNRRGRQMTKKQIMMLKKRKLYPEDKSSAEPPDKRLKPTSGLINSFVASSPAGDRLKPPPSCVDLTKKTIKLGGSSTSSSSLSSASSPVISSSMKKLSLFKTLHKEDEREKHSSTDYNISVITTGTVNNHQGTGTLIKLSVTSGTPQSNIHSPTSKCESAMMEVTAPDTEAMDTSTVEEIQREEKKKPKIRKISWP